MPQQGPQTLTLEINPNNKLIAKLNDLRITNRKLADDVCRQLCDNAQVAAGIIDDPRSMIGRIESFMEKAMDNKA